MKKSLNHLLASALLLALLVPSIDAIAADNADKTAKRAALQLKKMQQEMQANFEQEKAALQLKLDEETKAKAALEEQVSAQAAMIKKLSASEDVAESKLRNLEVTQKKVTAEKTSLDAQQKQTQQQLETSNKNLAELKLQHAQILGELKTNETQRKTQLANITQTRKSLETCQEKNAKLHAFGTELIHIYEAPNGLATAKSKPDFFKSKNIELENILQDHQDKLDMERLSVTP